MLNPSALICAVVLAFLFGGCATSESNRSSEPSTDLHQSAAGGDVEDVKYWLTKNPARVNTVETNHGLTPLHLAARPGLLGQWGPFGKYTETVDYLLQNGADVRATDVYGYTPLHQAASWNLVSGAKLEDAPNGGVILTIEGQMGTAKQVGRFELKESPVKRQLRTIEMLLNRGGDVNLKTTNNATPLHLAAAAGHVEIVKFLLQKGASKDMKTMVKGVEMTAAQIAEKNKRDQSVVRLLSN